MTEITASFGTLLSGVQLHAAIFESPKDFTLTYFPFHSVTQHFLCTNTVRTQMEQACFPAQSIRSMDGHFFMLHTSQIWNGVLLLNVFSCSFDSQIHSHGVITLAYEGTIPTQEI